MKLIVAGTRTFNNYILLEAMLDNIKNHISEIVSGRQTGADKLGERYAKRNNIPIKPFPPDWNSYNKAAGPIRNEQMAKYADGLLAFWDNSSRGTRSMIQLAKDYNLPFIRIIIYNRNPYTILNY